MNQRLVDIAAEIARSAGEEATMVARLSSITWLSEAARDRVLDDVRRRYDLLVEGHQIILARAKVEL
jgi:hypothetical protein